MKKCIRCGFVKQLDQYNAKRNECKPCQKVSKKQWYEINRQKCLDYRKEYAVNNVESIRKTRYRINRENSESISSYNKKRYYENRQKNIDRVSAWQNQKRKNDLLFKIKFNLRCRVYTALKRKNKSIATKKNDNKFGCSIDFLKKHIESQFDKKMSWENYGTYWHIDHIYPLSRFDLTNENELLMANHYTNLQPLEAKENIRKGNKII